jgi:type I restriction enzyme, S subunit
MNKWPLVLLGDIFEIARGGSPRPIQNFITDDPNGVNWIMISDASESSKYINFTKKKIIKSGVKHSRMVYPNDFLLTNSMSFGRPYIMQTSGCIHDGWLVLSKKTENVNQDYFFHLLGSALVFSEFTKQAAGATVKNLNIDVVKGIKVHLPPIPEQRRIAEILDKADELRAKRRSALALLDTLSQSIFHEFYQKSRKVFREISLVDVAEATRGSFVNGPFGSDLLTSELQDEGVPVVYIRDIRFGEYRRVSKVCVTERKACDLAVCSVRPGDVLVAKVGDPPGISAVYPKEEPNAVVTQDVIRIRLAADLAIPEFLVAYLNSSIGCAKVEGITIEATRARFSLGDFKRLKIELPPVNLQQDFARRVAAVDKLKAVHRASLAKLDEFFASLQYRAFRGEL